jgi:hypothetical protein
LSESLHSEAQGTSLGKKKGLETWLQRNHSTHGGIGSIGGISSGERSIIGISQLPVIYQVELLAYEYHNQNIYNSTLHFHLQIIVT